MLNEAIAMIHLGDHKGQYVYEPVNHHLRSPEDGCRFHRSMNVSDVYDDPLDIATWGRPVTGQYQMTGAGWSSAPL